MLLPALLCAVVHIESCWTNYPKSLDFDDGLRNKTKPLRSHQSGFLLPVDRSTVQHRVRTSGTEMILALYGYTEERF